MEMTMHGGTVRLTMSAKVAGDLGALQKGLKSLAERLGHPFCATGCDILHLGMEREFTFGGVGQEAQAKFAKPPPQKRACGGATTGAMATGDRCDPRQSQP